MILFFSKQTKEYNLYNRTQSLSVNPDYSSEEVVFPNVLSDIKLAGTLTFPQRFPPKAVVVLLSGSGPQDRNEQIANHKPFEVIADHLTEQGIAVLRFDDRGVGGSGGVHSTSSLIDFSNDAKAAISIIKSDNRLKEIPLGLIGHSEGGVVAALAAMNTRDVNFIVMLSTPGLPGAKIYRDQYEVLHRKSNYSETKLIKKLEYIDHVIKVILNHNIDEDIRSRIYQAVASLVDIDIDASDVKANSTEGWINIFNSKSFRSMIKTNPGDIFGKIAIPVLAIAGERDLIVSPVANLDAISNAINNKFKKNLVTYLIPELNHLLQHSKTGMPNEYALIEETIANEVLVIISDWIDSNAKIM